MLTVCLSFFLLFSKIDLQYSGFGAKILNELIVDIGIGSSVGKRKKKFDFRMSLSEREYVNWLKTNVWLIELAELPNPPDRRSIKRVFERTPEEYWEKLEEK